MNELKNGKLYKDSLYPSNYSEIVYLADSTISWNTNGDLIFRLLNDNTLICSNNTIRLNYWFELKQEKYQFIFYSCLKIMIPNKKYIILFEKDLHNKLICYDEIINLPKLIKQYKISDTIKHVEDVFRLYLEIEVNNYDINKACYFFGVYNLEDLNNILNHKGDINIIFGGSDLDLEMNHCRKLIPRLREFIKHNKNVRIYFISKNLQERGKSLELFGTLVRLDLIGDKWDRFKCNINDVINRNYIYCYTGCKRLGKLYNYDLILEIERELSEYKFIYSHKLDLEHEKMIDIYNKCFVGLRLTKKDGNANTVIEMGKLGIPIIFNGDEINSINYDFDNKNDIIKKIRSIKKLEI